MTSYEVVEPNLQRIELYLKAMVDRGLRNNEDSDGECGQKIFRPDAAARVPSSASDTRKRLHLRSTLNPSGQLDVDDHGCEDFYGHSSGFAFLSQIRRKYRNVFNANIGPSTIVTIRPGLPQLFDLPQSLADSRPYDPPPLPPIEVANDLVDYALENVCVLSRVVHRPTFNTMLNKIYEVPPDKRGIDETRFLPLLYAVLALGFFALPAKVQKIENEGAMVAR
jgi:hypothetical protein